MYDFRFVTAAAEMPTGTCAFTDSASRTCGRRSSLPSARGPGQCGKLMGPPFLDRCFYDVRYYSQLYAARGRSTSFEAATINDLKTTVTELPSQFGDARINEIAKEILTLV